MGSVEEIMQLCRLCLVKDQVNVPIFDELSDSKETFHKICSCLPVKVSQEDNLPKKICDGCSYKLDMLYVFRNTSVESEKQLATWLNQAGLSAKPEVLVKQETFETVDVRADNETGDIEGESDGYLYQEDFGFGDTSDEPAPKKAKRTATKIAHETESHDEDIEAAMQITKAEEEDSNDIDQPDYVEPSTSADDQPGPSGLGKDNIEAPFFKQDLIIQQAFPCKMCPVICPSKRTFRKHLHHHKVNGYECPVCSQKIQLKKDVEKHIAVSHADYKPFECSFCMNRFMFEKYLNAHVIKTHLLHDSCKCEDCGAAYNNLRSLTKHREVEHEGKLSVCPHCKKQFKDPGHFKLHLRTHDPDFIQDEFPCLTCGKIYKSRRGFQRHMKEHDGSHTNVVCDVCGKSFVYSHHLSIHQRTHTGERPYVCDTCGKGFICSTRLVEHKRVHTKERPFICHICNKGFTQKNSLNVHVRSHTGEKPYQCEICSKRFIVGSLLKNHTCRL